MSVMGVPVWDSVLGSVFASPSLGKFPPHWSEKTRRMAQENVGHLSHQERKVALLEFRLSQLQDELAAEKAKLPSSPSPSPRVQDQGHATGPQ